MAATAPARPDDGPPPPVDPRAWQGALVGLLARLEHHRSELANRRLGADAGLLLDRAEAMVAAADDLARKTRFPPKLAAGESSAVAKAGVFVSAAQAVRGGLHQGLFRSVLSAFGGGQTAPGVGPAVRVCLDAAAAALNGYFTLFTDHYPSSLAARPWVDAATALLSEYKQLVRELAE